MYGSSLSHPDDLLPRQNLRSPFFMVCTIRFARPSVSGWLQDVLRWSISWYLSWRPEGAYHPVLEYRRQLIRLLLMDGQYDHRLREVLYHDHDVCVPVLRPRQRTCQVY